MGVLIKGDVLLYLYNYTVQHTYTSIGPGMFALQLSLYALTGPRAYACHLFCSYVFLAYALVENELHIHFDSYVYL